MIGVDQDPLGRQAKILKHSDEELLLSKEMEDGSLAVGIFNLKNQEIKYKLLWEVLGWNGKTRVRDLWRQADLGTFDDRCELTIAAHGVYMLRLLKN